MNILVTGYNGFLMQEIMASELYSEYNFIEFKFRVENELSNDYIDDLRKLNISEIWHFGGPSTIKDDDHTTIYNQIVLGTIRMNKLAFILDCRIVFASSEAVQFETSIYSSYKREAEEHLEDNFKIHNVPYISLRIPRVYGSNKTRGLFKGFIEDTISPNDMKKKISYMDIRTFLKLTSEILNRKLECSIVKYRSDCRIVDNLQDIKNKYL